MLPETETVTFL